jgi:hypothetical protein
LMESAQKSLTRRTLLLLKHCRYASPKSPECLDTGFMALRCTQLALQCT